MLVASGARVAVADGPFRILMLGDSLTAGYGLATREALPARLEAALRSRAVDARVINAGVSGDTTAGGLARIEWALADDPHAVIVALGANDGLRAIDPAVTRKNLDRLLGLLAGRGLPVLLAGMVAPPNLGPGYAARFDPIYPELAVRHGAILYPFLLDGVATVAALNQRDGIHPNAAGVETIAERMLPAVLCLVRGAKHPAAAALEPSEEGACCTRTESVGQGDGDRHDCTIGPRSFDAPGAGAAGWDHLLIGPDPRFGHRPDGCLPAGSTAKHVKRGPGRQERSSRAVVAGDRPPDCAVREPQPGLLAQSGITLGPGPVTGRT